MVELLQMSGIFPQPDNTPQSMTVTDHSHLSFLITGKVIMSVPSLQEIIVTKPPHLFISPNQTLVHCVRKWRRGWQMFTDVHGGYGYEYFICVIGLCIWLFLHLSLCHPLGPGTKKDGQETPTIIMWMKGQELAGAVGPMLYESTGRQRADSLSRAFTQPPQAQGRGGGEQVYWIQLATKTHDSGLTPKRCSWDRVP